MITFFHAKKAATNDNQTALLLKTKQRSIRQKQWTKNSLCVWLAPLGFINVLFQLSFCLRWQQLIWDSFLETPQTRHLAAKSFDSKTRHTLRRVQSPETCIGRNGRTLIHLWNTNTTGELHSGGWYPKKETWCAAKRSQFNWRLSSFQVRTLKRTNFQHLTMSSLLCHLLSHSHCCCNVVWT